MAYVIVEGPAIAGKPRDAMAKSLEEAVARGFNQEPGDVVVVFKRSDPMSMAHVEVQGEIATEITVEGGRIFPGSRDKLIKEVTEAAVEGFRVSSEQVLILVKGKGGAHMDTTTEAVGLGGVTLAQKLNPEMSAKEIVEELRRQD